MAAVDPRIARAARFVFVFTYIIVVCLLMLKLMVAHLHQQKKAEDDDKDNSVGAVVLLVEQWCTPVRTPLISGQMIGLILTLPITGR